MKSINRNTLHPIQSSRTGAGLKSRLINSLCLAAPLSLGLLFGTPAWSAPSIQSVSVSPNPLVAGENFTIAVTAAADVTQAVATVEFHPGQINPLEIPLRNQGSLWTGSALVPSDFTHPAKAEAEITVLAFKANGHRQKKDLHVDVVVPIITAVFSNGVLTVTGDDHDNTLIVSRDLAGDILVNGGTVPVIGGVPTVDNTTLIRILGLGGNDVLTVDDANGPMPSANLFGGDGDDVLTGSAADDVLDGGPGNDTLFGRDGNDTLIGGPGNDILVGGRGTDVMQGGDGDDQIIWNPGDGSDVVEGGAGQDTLVFNGANVNETVDLSANGQRLRFFRNVANITMDCDGIETVVFHALGGSDVVTVNDLTGTSVTNVLIDLAIPPNTGDGKSDMVIVNGTVTNDNIKVSGSTNGVDVTGLAATVSIVGAEPGLDSLVINANAGDDVVDASALEAATINLTLNGGDGNDILIGSQGNDLLNGGRGNDTMFGGPGDDTFVWNPGDGSDVIEGQAGNDTMLFNGANVAETVDISANGQRVRFFRNVANIVMDCDGVENIQFNALGGADNITVHDLTGTDTTKINLDLGAPTGSGTGDGAADVVTIEGTTGSDVVNVTGTPAEVDVTGLAAAVSIVGTDPTMDQLVIKALDGDDVVTATDLQAGAINLTIDGGPGNDLLIGSHGNDVLLGGDGDDILFGGPGQDVLDGGTGNNLLIQD